MALTPPILRPVADFQPPPPPPAPPAPGATSRMRAVLGGAQLPAEVPLFRPTADYAQARAGMGLTPPQGVTLQPNTGTESAFSTAKRILWDQPQKRMQANIQREAERVAKVQGVPLTPELLAMTANKFNVLGAALGVGSGPKEVPGGILGEAGKVAKGAASAAARQPWQMTFEEFSKTPHNRGDARFIGNQFHHDFVKEALSEGKPVPPEVLAEYPDLAPVSPPTAVESPQTPAVTAQGAQHAPVAPETGVAPAGGPQPPPVVYHGSPRQFEFFDPGKSRDALYGPGVYFTENPEVAKGYARPNASQTATVLDARLKAGTVFNVDAPVDPTLLSKAEQIPSFDWFEKPGNYTNDDLYQALVDGLGNRSEANDWLLANGYNTITHIGGKATGTAPHRVWIALGSDPNGVLGDVSGQAEIVGRTSLRATAAEMPRIAEPAPAVPTESPPSPNAALLANIQAQIDEAKRNPGFRHKIVAHGTPIEAPPVEPPGGKPPTVATTPTEATQHVKAIQQKGQQAPESVTPQEAQDAHIEMGAPDGPRPPKPPRPTGKGGPPPSDDPTDIMRQIADQATQGERPDQTLLRLHEAAISAETRRTGITVRDGNAKLRTLGIGEMRRGQLVPRTEDIPKLDALYNALHNPSKVASGEIMVPKGYEAIYQDLRGLTDWEQAARLDFDPEMATVADYFYRGWKPPEGAVAGVTQGRPLVKTPAFKKPRVDATYQEMRDAGFEPLFWNPYQQWGLSRMQGTKYREQMQLVKYLKGMGEDFARPHLGGPIPQGWRVPEVGPAFEGKPFATTDAAGEPTTMFTRRWIVPDRVANTLENIYGKRPDLGRLTVGTKTIDPLAVIDFLTFMPKRAKLVGSLFQQVDFLTRAGAGSWTRAVDALFAGQPIEAVKALVRYPKTAATIIRANFSPGLRQSLARQLDSTVPLVKGRPGVNLKGVSEAGLSTFDPSMFRWEEMDRVTREVAQETGILSKGRAAARAVGDLESAMRRGLFEGVYPAAMMTDIRNNIAPMLARMYPKLNDAQLNGTIARIVNMKYSSIPASQSVIQNRALRETLRRVFFSMGESEGLLRQAASTVGGPNKKFWAKHWLGTYLFILATAEAIHYASTGELLPKERYSPISQDKWGPLPFGYNTRFASPTIPLKGRGGAEITLDVVGQMDTALRVLNPGQFLTSRESVPIRAIVNQVSGADFFGNPINDVGPGGVVSRTAQLAQDLFSPIGAGGISSELARRNIPGAEKIINEGETRLGLTGLGVQATGVNLRAATREQRLKSTWGARAQTTLAALDSLGMNLGYVTRNFDMASGRKGGEITLTSGQREQLQWLTDDTVVQGLAPFVASPQFKSMAKERQQEAIKERVATLRTQARDRFRRMFRSTAVQPASVPNAPAPTMTPRLAPPTQTPASRMRQVLGAAVP